MMTLGCWRAGGIVALGLAAGGGCLPLLGAVSQEVQYPNIPRRAISKAEQ